MEDMDRCFVEVKKMGVKWKFLLRFSHLYQVITNETYKVQWFKSDIYVVLLKYKARSVYFLSIVQLYDR